jgi:hypothetical protein
MRVPRQVLVFLAVVGLVIGLLAIVIAARRPISRPLAYWAIDQRTLGIVVIDAPGIQCAVAGVDESADYVRVSAACFEPWIPLPMAGGAHLNVMQANLRAPLSSRKVLDGSGNVGTLCQKPPPDCMPPL